jgi:hypothetical protein
MRRARRSDAVLARQRAAESRRRLCSRCGCIGSVVLCVLGLPLVIFNSPACFFGGGDFAERLYEQRKALLLEYNRTVREWESSGRARCQSVMPLYIRTTRGVTALNDTITARTSGDIILDLRGSTGDVVRGLGTTMPLRMIAPGACTMGANRPCSPRANAAQRGGARDRFRPLYTFFGWFKL